MITRIEAKRYRSLKNVGIDLPQYAILVGANGAGKTTFLDIPRLIGDCLRQRNISSAFLQRQDERSPRCSVLSELVFKSEGSEFVLALEAALPKTVVKKLVKELPPSMQDKKERHPKTIRYELLLKVSSGKGIRVKKEHLFLLPPELPANRKGAKLRWDDEYQTIIQRTNGEAHFRLETESHREVSLPVTTDRLALEQALYAPEELFPTATWFCELLIQDYLFYQPDLAALQVASPPGLPDTLRPDASNLPFVALRLQQHDKSRFKLWEDHVKTALPNIEKIELKEREEDHHTYCHIHYKGGYAITSSSLSEGTLRLLALTLLPYIDNLPAIVFLEEPENGIHPQAIETVLQSLSSAYESQVLIGSHSPVVLANSELDQILCCRLSDDGATTIVTGRDHPQLKNWKGAIDLGMLFATGVME